MTLRSAADPMAQQGRLVGTVSTLTTAPTPAGPTVQNPVSSERGVARAQLDALAGVVEDLAGQFELRPLLQRILRHAVGLLGCHSGSICTVDERRRTYRKEVDLGVACRSGDEFPLTEGVTGEILRAGGPVTFAEYSHVRGGHIDPSDRADLHATIGVPIRWSGAVIGACIVFSRDPGRRFEAADVTLLELFAGHAALAMVNARMHAQAAELARAEATSLERERIVRDVHDSVSRALASVVLHLGNAQSPAARPESADPGEPARDHLGLARLAAQSALSETRRTVLGLRPALPQAPTIDQAIQTQVAWARSTGLDIRLVVAGPPRTLPSEVVDELFGLAQQAIANIVAHADARTARVGLVYGADEVVLLIQDDGVGFDATELPRPDGSWAGSTGPGLPQLSEIAIRTEHLGGTVQIDATPGWGTTIRAAVPYLTLPPAPAAGRSTVLIVEHRPLVRAGLVAILGQAGETVQVVGEVETGDDLPGAYRLLQPDVVLIDSALPAGAAAVIAGLRRHHPDAAVVAIADAAAGDGRLREVVQAGARAVVMIEADGSALARAIGAVARGDALFTDDVLHGLYDDPADAALDTAMTLTPREHEVHTLVSQGLPDKQIAERLHISVKTVEKHVGSALRKTGTRNRTELAGINGRIHR
jgi:signal transduction histidine kinase/DNA-binding NarL/FixJ family response regulator